MKKIFTSILVVTSYILSAQSLSLDFAYNYGSTGVDEGKKISYDASGNIYMLGTFSGTVDIDFGAGTSNLVSAGGVDIFLAKYTSLGSLVWGFKIGNASGTNTPTDLIIDNAGNVIITGNISGSNIDFNPGAGVSNLSTSGNGYLNGFIAKYDASGNFVFANKIESNVSSNQLVSAATDQTNNIYVTGPMQGVTDFDPIGTYTLSQTTSSLVGIYFAKYTATGTLSYAKLLDNFAGSTGPYIDIAVNSLNEVVLGCSFAALSADLDPSAATYTIASGSATNLGLVAKYNNVGDFVYAFALTGSNNSKIQSIAVDANDDIVVGGNFFSTVDFDPSPSTYTIAMTPSGGPDAFLAKYSGSGNFQWAQKIGASGLEEIYGLKVKNNFIYALGLNATGTDFEPSLATVTSNSGGNFVAKYDLTGSFFWAFSYLVSGNAGGGFDIANGGDVIVTGNNTLASVDMDPTANTYTIGTNGSNDIYIAQYSQMCSAPINVVDFTTNGNKTICENNSTTLLAAGSGTVSWYSSPSSTVAISTGTTLTTSTLSAGNYTFYAEGYTCMNSANRTAITVTVNSAPTLSVATSNSLSCVGEAITLTASGASTYSWTTGSSQPSISVSPTVTTNYTVTGTASGCSNTSVFTQSVSLCTGIESFQQSGAGLVIFPNPNNGEFTIQAQNEDVLTIINDLGQMIETIELSHENNFLYRVSGLQGGIYFIIGKTVKQKVIVCK
jgi:hypothetical protein